MTSVRHVASLMLTLGGATVAAVALGAPDPAAPTMLGAGVAMVAGGWLLLAPDMW